MSAVETLSDARARSEIVKEAIHAANEAIRSAVEAGVSVRVETNTVMVFCGRDVVKIGVSMAVEL